ncbi:MAG: PfkB family carbohydrate kinase [Candidatus Accumulibacter sp.]|nr:PfkB family carbohydrate kinase [Accumulibacter sp.]
MIAVGAICSATIFRVGEIPPLPAKVLPSERCQLVDGMAVSAAFAFSRLGGSAQVWSRIGDDWLGRMARQSLIDEGFDVAGVHVVPGAATSQVAIIVDRRGDRLVVPFHDPDADPSPVWLPLAELENASFLHCETRWAEGAAAALEAARARGIPCMVDGEVAPVETLRRLIPLADYAVFSDAGLLIHAGGNDVEQALLKVGAAHRGHVGASCGAGGYAWYEKGRIRRVGAPRVAVVDTLAAGDIFHGAFALALVEGKSIEDAARFACAAASLKCTRFGGRLGCPSRAEVETFLASAADAGTAV